MKKQITTGLSLALMLTVCLIFSCRDAVKTEPLKVAISPYQDLAMFVNIDNLGLEKKYGTDLDLLTMNWENILPALASSGNSIDVGFGSLAEFLTKENNINKGVKDSLVFIYPAYVFKGGGFVTYKKDIPVITAGNLSDKATIQKFLSSKIGTQKNSVYDMMVYSLAKRNSIDPASIKLFNTTLNDGILATKNGSLDIASAGLTQITEAQKENGRVVLTMESMGFADITGFVCKQSTLKAKRKQIEDMLHMWFYCVAYVMKDLDKNSKASLAYLDQKAATKYTLDQYKTALSQEYFPLTAAEANSSMISADGKFSYQRISSDMVAYLLTNKIITDTPRIPVFIDLK
jgi:ABC-type nitrate/sulfonate/bicarbonate transport system substrate-binding protein